MIHHGILHRIKTHKQQVSFIYPYYGRYSIAEVSATIMNQFGVKSGRPLLDLDFSFDMPAFKKTVFFLIDGLGFNHFIDYHQNLPFFQQLANRADVYPLTSVFPSTTAAALTTLHTNLTPQEHGLPEWTVYFEEFDQIIETFPFRPLMSPEREALLTMGGKPEMLYAGPTVYEALAAANVPSFVFISKDYIQGSYSSATHKGSTVMPFTSAEDLLQNLLRLLKEVPAPAYYFVYWSHIDSIEHVYGPRSKEHILAMNSFSEAMMNVFVAGLSGVPTDDTLLLLASDHGQASIKGKEIIYLNNYLKLEESYLWGRSTKSIYPTGSPHDVFLHIYKPRVKDILYLLRQELEDKADVMTTDEAIKQGLFGLNQPAARFLNRVGDILILPYEGYHVWYRHAPGSRYEMKGIHGGLSQEEMIVPLAVTPLSALAI